MSEIKDGGPAFPGGTYYAGDGLSLRDYFAAKAMAALIEELKPGQSVDSSSASEYTRYTAEGAYMFADAMLKAREQS